ncbi:thiol-disulfide oxidoreductase DCC family protein [Natronoarchaeum sp. GCM10025703]|uniref:thiol-disulfide oxidoreductase DCC family protein n=1 Tax=unclassified Natronoarchaeum TaxID=2620183 RepID=UPI00361F23A9
MAEPAARDDPDSTVDPEHLEGPVLLFDGVCNLCNASVQFIIERDDEGVFSFASLQWDSADELLDAVGAPHGDLDSVVLIEDGQYYRKSSAAIRAARHLGLPWSLLAVGTILPKRVRDRIYDFVAEHRYGWFGKKDQCMIPDEDVSDRFLD